MNVLIVYYHPEPQSFNGAMFRTARDTLTAAGHTVLTSDLQAMAFNPISGRHNFHTVHDPDYYKQQLEEIHATENRGFVPELEGEMRKLEACDLMIWQFPLWWFGLPAPLKGGVDRVFAMGRTYGGGHIYGSGLFRGKRAMLSLTTGGPHDAYVKGGFNGDIMGVLRPIQRGMLQFLGFEVLAPHVVYGPVRLTEEERRHQLAVYARRLDAIGDETPVTVGDY